MMRRAFEWVRAVVVLAFLAGRERWRRRVNAKLAGELAWKTLAAEACEGGAGVAQRPARREMSRAEVDAAQIRRCIDQNLATLRTVVDTWPEGKLHQMAAAAVAMSDAEGLNEQVRVSALLQYTAIQVLEVNRLELEAMGEA